MLKFIKKQTVNDWIMWFMFFIGALLLVACLTTKDKVISSQYAIQAMLCSWFGLIYWQVSKVLDKLQKIDERMNNLQ